MKSQLSLCSRGLKVRAAAFAMQPKSTALILQRMALIGWGLRRGAARCQIVQCHRHGDLELLSQVQSSCVPHVEEFHCGSTANQVRVGYAFEVHPWDMTRCGVVILDVPDCIGCLREMISLEISAIDF